MPVQTLLPLVLACGLFAAVGAAILWRWHARRDWVRSRAVVIGNSLATRTVLVALDGVDPPRAASIAWHGRGHAPGTGQRIAVAHPPGRPAELHIARSRGWDLAMGILFLIAAAVGLWAGLRA